MPPCDRYLQFTVSRQDHSPFTIPPPWYRTIQTAGFAHDKVLIMIGTILIVLLILMLLGSFPRFGYNRNWGYAPFGGLGLILLIVILLVLLGRV